MIGRPPALRGAIPAMRVIAVLAMILALAGCAQAPAADSPATAAAPAYTPNPQPAQETDVQYRARLHTELGANYFARGQFDVAIEELNEALKLKPDHATAYGVLALVYMDMGEYDRADANFARALQIAPQDPEIRNNYGWYLCQRGRPQDGLAQFDQALRSPLYRTPELALLNAGRCHLRMGDLRSAEGYFKRVATIQPGNAKAAFGLAEVAYREGRFNDAGTLIRPAMQSPLPETLLLAGCIDRRVGNALGERAVLAQLRSLYPDAQEVKALETGACP